MDITINGKPAHVERATTLADIIEQKKLKPSLVAIERNGEIVPRSEFERTELAEGDRLEIVHFVGGG